MREELIINGESVDTGGVGISLEYVNNLLTSVDKISSSHSYTISLPITARNERILDMPTSVAHRSSKVGTYLPAEYRRNGITIVRNAKAYITGVGKSIDICLIWDNLAKYTEWVKEGKKVGDLGFTNPVYKTSADRYRSIATNPVVHGYITSEGTDATLVGLNLWNTIQRIMNGIGAEWECNESGVINKAIYMALLCTKFNGGLSNYSVYKGVKVDTTPRANGYLLRFTGGGMQLGYIPFKENSTGVLIDLSFSLSCDVAFSSANVKLYGHTDGSDTLTLLKTYTMSTSQESRVVSLDQIVTIQKESYTDVVVYISGIASQVSQSSFQATGKVSYTQYLTNVEVGDTFHIETNAPDIKQIDVLKTFCAMYGLSLMTRPDGCLELVRMDRVADRANAIDWTERIVNFDSAKVEYKLSNYAKRNWIRYTEDTENGGVDVDSYIESPSDTLGDTLDLIKMPFAVTSGSVIEFKKTSTDGTVEYKDVKPRIVKMTSRSEGAIPLNATIQYAWSQEQNASSIITSYYKRLSLMLEYPVTLKVYARLTEKDLGMLKMYLPVYLGQTGQHYIISKVKTDNESDICEIELIQM